MSIGQRIQQAREKKGLSQSKLSRQLYLSRGVCGHWEREISNPSTAHLAKLADILDVSVEWLATGSGDSAVDSSKRISVHDFLRLVSEGNQQRSEELEQDSYLWSLQVKRLYSELTTQQKAAVLQLLLSMQVS